MNGISRMAALGCLAAGLLGLPAPHCRAHGGGNGAPAPRLLAGAAGGPAARIPLFFTANQGQFAPGVAYAGKGPGWAVEFGQDGVRFWSPQAEFRLEFVGSSWLAGIEGADPVPGRANYLFGPDQRDWRMGVPLVAGVRYRGLYPGIDLVYRAEGGRLKAEFHLAPGADPGAIRMRYGGAERLEVSGDGALWLITGAGRLREAPPVSYQEADGNRVEVDSAYQVSGDEVAFDLGPYDPARPLVIDPEISFSTYLGGNGGERATGVAVDAAGAVFVAGYTDSSDFPTRNARQPSRGGSTDAFLAKLNNAGNGLEWATYLGGSGDDRAAGVALDGAGYPVIAGSTSSANFPVLAAHQSSTGGGRDAFVARFSASGALIYSTYLGGAGSDGANGVASDAAGNAYVALETDSANFPVLGGVQSAGRGGQDAAMAKLAPGGALLVSSYLGGSGSDAARAVAVDAAGNVYLAGETASADFPLENAFQAASAGGQDGFVAKIASAGNDLLFSTYLGGSLGGGAAPEAVYAIKVDAGGSPWVAGAAASANFPLAGAVQSSFGGGETDAFVSKLASDGRSLVFSTFLGGLSFDAAAALALDAAGNVYVAGRTSSANFPTTGGLQAFHTNGYDAFLVKLPAAGSPMSFGTFLGGTGFDGAYGVAVDSFGDAYLAGQSSSTDFPLLYPYQSANLGPNGVFVTRVGFSGRPVAVSSTPSSGSGTTQTFRFLFYDSSGYADLHHAVILVNSTLSIQNACYLYYDRAANTVYLANDNVSLWSAIALGAAGSLENSQCRVNAGASSAAASGKELALNLALVFKPAFGGARTFYLYAQDNGGLDSGMQARGSWSVPSSGNSAPAAVSVTPSSGSASTQTFQFRFSDGDGWTDIHHAVILVNSSISIQNACYLYYDRAGNQIYLADDAGAGWTVRTLGTAGTLQNSQCAVNVGVSSAGGAGAELTANLALTFKAAFAGARNVYLYVEDNAGSSSGMQQRGSWTVPGGGNLPPAAVSVAPSSGSGASQTFQFLFSDPNGYPDLHHTVVLINATLSIQNACYLYYDRGLNTIYLANDDVSSWSQKTLGSAGTLENSQCAVDASASLAAGAGNDLSLSLALAFKAAFAGTKTIYLYAEDNSTASSGMQARGTWTR